MWGRVLIGAGGLVVVGVVTGLAVYFAVVGLDAADKAASVVSAFAGLAGLGIAGWGLVIARRNEPTGPPRQGGRVRASGARSIATAGDITGIASTGDGATNTQQR